MGEESLPTEWAHTAKLAREGDTEAARDLLKQFVLAVALAHPDDWPRQLPMECAQYIAEAFRRIVDDNVGAAKALGLVKNKAGRPKGGGITHDPVKLGSAYWLLLHRGYAPEQANEAIRRATGADRRTIQRARYTCSALEHADDPLLVAILSEKPAQELLLALIAEQPAAKMGPIPTAD